ncbi:universal stress protein [Natronobacterium texcoconense]|uniref:Nucleotide-binding universal stress protein, UspA family n=1 Tax=Natronobacterium texcoconense TaxID=1095778 RepID=A0A1H1EHW2_NATTX|nr:universal stress protein [Natronobacterium texcoconense]SDQ88293.1 Nucleotide-binding universal stress protein, UspA family [Natronobacterium texcoconense]
MVPYDSILLPTDGSETAELATERAVDMADRHDAELHALYVAERTREEPTQQGLEEKLAREIDEGKDVMDVIERQAAKRDVETTTTVEPGVPRTTIEEYADEHGIGLIVIGSTGASDVTEKLLGTVAKYVVNEAPADVFVVRPDKRLR